jgi:hypothetical protein
MFGDVIGSRTSDRSSRVKRRVQISLFAAAIVVWFWLCSDYELLRVSCCSYVVVLLFFHRNSNSSGANVACVVVSRRVVSHVVPYKFLRFPSSASQNPEVDADDNILPATVSIVYCMTQTFAVRGPIHLSKNGITMVWTGENDVVRRRCLSDPYILFYTCMDEYKI